MAQQDDQNDFDFGFEPGIDTLSQNGVPTATATDASDAPPIEANEAEGHSSTIFVLAFLSVGALIFAVPYFF